MAEQNYKQYILDFRLSDGTTHSIPLKVPYGKPGADGGYYTPVVNQVSDTEVQIIFKPSKSGMPELEPAVITVPAGKDYVLTEADKSEIAELAAGMVDIPEVSGNAGFVVQPDAPVDTSVLWVDTDDNTGDCNQGGGISITGAKVGQTVKISAVDENGVPTAWESVDFPSGGSGGKWELINEGTITEDVNRLLIDKDINGNDFELVSWYLYAVLEPCETNGTGSVHTEVNKETVCTNVSANLEKTRYYQSRGEIIGGYTAIVAQSISDLTFNNQWSISNFTPSHVNFYGENAKSISLYYGINNIAGANSKYILYGVRA